MSVSGDASEQVVRLSLEGFEVLAKLTGSGAKNVAAMLYTIMKDKKQTKGKTRLNNMLKAGKPLKIFSIKNEDLETFKYEAKKYGILYCALVDKKHINYDGMTDIMVKDEDASRINRIVERFKLTTIDTAKIDTEVTKAIENREAQRKELGVQKKSKEELLEEVLQDKLSYAWDMTVLQRILEDQTYCGDTIQNRGKLISYKVHKHVKNPQSEWIIVRNTHEAIIDRDTWKKVQEAINYRDTRVCKTGYLTYFAGHIKCADCGRAMCKNPSGYYKGKPRPYYYYVCSTYKQRSIDLCTSHNIRNTILEESVLQAIKMQIKLIVDFEQTLIDIKSINNIDYRIETMKDRLKNLEQKSEKQKNLKKMAYEDWKLGNITEEEYKEYSISYTNSINRIQENIQNIQNELAKFNKNDDNAIWIDKFTKYRNITELSKEVVDELIEDIYVHEGKEITIKFKYEDEYQRAIEYIKRNENLTLLRNEEKLG